MRLIKVEVSNGTILEIDGKSARHCGLLVEFMDSNSSSDTIHLPELNPKAVEFVLKWCMKHRDRDPIESMLKDILLYGCLHWIQAIIIAADKLAFKPVLFENIIV